MLFREPTHLSGMRVTDGGRGGNRPLASQMQKTGPQLAYILVFSILLVFSRLFFFEVFFCDFRFEYVQPH